MSVIEALSADLSDRRRLLGLSREEAYKKFRVPLAFIHAIEDGQLERLPAHVYARGFLRTYCEGLGIPAEPRLDLLDEALHQRTGFRVSFFGVSGIRRPAWVDDVRMWAAIVGFLLVGWLAYSIVFNPGARAHETGVQAQTVDLLGEDPFAAP